MEGGGVGYTPGALYPGGPMPNISYVDGHASAEVSARAYGAAEITTLPLLRQHAAGNTSWLQQLNATAAAGGSLPEELLTPPPGQLNGTAAVPLLLFYRRDWWQRLVSTAAAGGGDDGAAAAAAAALPPTWPLLSQLLSAGLNQDLDGDGRPDHVLCADLMPGCKGWALLSAIFASLAQSRGTAQGAWFNATDLSPTLGAAAMPAALRLYAALASANAAPFTPGGPNVSRSAVPVGAEELLAGGGAVEQGSGAPLCGAVNPLFAAGRCLFTVDWATAALRLTREHAPGISGFVSADLLPGSTVVVSPSPPGGRNGSAASSDLGLQPCSAEICPNAISVGALGVQGLLNVVRLLEGPDVQTELAPLSGSPVSRAPLIGEASCTWLLQGNRTAPALLRTEDFIGLLAFELDLKYGALLSGANASGQVQWEGPLGRRDPPIYASPLTEADTLSLLDMEAEDFASVRQATLAGISHPNAALDVLLPGSPAYRRALDELALSALRAAPEGYVGQPVGSLQDLAAPTTVQQQQAITQADDAFRAALEEFPYRGILLQMYWRFLGLPPDGNVNGDRATPGGDSAALRIGLPVSVSVGGVLLLGLLLAGCALYASRMAAPPEHPYRNAQPPGPGPATTLVMTDVQNSTLLWELLSQDVMDHCVSIHHRIMRESISAHRGFEVFTEGDAFAVAFHTPDDALGFALMVQESLLHADWPAELLAQPDGCEVWARRCWPHLQLHGLASTPSMLTGMTGQPTLPALLEVSESILSNFVGGGSTKSIHGTGSGDHPSAPNAATSQRAADAVPQRYDTEPAPHRESGLVATWSAGRSQSAAGPASAEADAMAQEGITPVPESGSYPPAVPETSTSEAPPSAAAKKASAKMLLSPFANQLPLALVRDMSARRCAGEEAATPRLHAPPVPASAPGSTTLQGREARAASRLREPPPDRLSNSGNPAGPGAGTRTPAGRARSNDGGATGGGARGHGDAPGEALDAEGEWRHVVNWDAGMPIPLSSSGRSMFPGFLPSAGVDVLDDLAGVRRSPQARVTFDGTQAAWDRSSAASVHRPGGIGTIKIEVAAPSLAAIAASHRMSLPRFRLNPMASLPSYNSFRHDLRDYKSQMTMPSNGAGASTPPPPPPTPSYGSAAPGPVSAPPIAARTGTLSRTAQNGLSRFGSSAHPDLGCVAASPVGPGAVDVGTTPPPALTKRGSIPRFVAGMAANLMPRLVGRSPSGTDRPSRLSINGAPNAADDPPTLRLPEGPALQHSPYPTCTAEVEGSPGFPAQQSKAGLDGARITAFPPSGEQRFSAFNGRSSRGNHSGTVGMVDALWRDVNAATGAGSHSEGGVGVGLDAAGVPRLAVNVSGVLQLLYEQVRTEDVPSLLSRGARDLERTLTGSVQGGTRRSANATAAAVLDPVLSFRGLRVRMGLHSGARDNEVLVLVKDGVQQITYTGDFLNTCKEISDAAMGGVVVLSGPAFRAYQQLLRQRGGQSRDAMLLHLGEHIIKQPSIERDSIPDEALGAPGAPPTRELYGAVDPYLAARLALLPSLVRTHKEVVPGCMGAPAGLVAPVFCNVVGVEALLAWESLLQERNMRAVAQVSTQGLATCRPLEHVLVSGDSSGVGIVRSAMELFCDLAQKSAGQFGGYVVASSADGGHWVLVFGSVEMAVRWGLHMLEAMLTMPWPDGFLEHDLTEEVWEEGVLTERGLRLRIGIDYGQAMVRLVPRTGRLDYVGRPMNRAARIAAKAKAATMLVSGAVWDTVRPALHAEVESRNLGSMQLKGVREALELWALKRRRLT